MDHREGVAILTLLTPVTSYIYNLVHNDVVVARRVNHITPTTDPDSPAPGLLGHRDGVRGPPGGVCHAQPGLALAAHPLGCPAPPLRCAVFRRYPLRDLNSVFWRGGDGEGHKATF